MRAAGGADLKLADAQFVVARAYGFASWRALKTHVEAAAPAHALDLLLGCYGHDPRILTNSVTTITRHGDRLYGQQTGGGRLALIPHPEGGYSFHGLPSRYSFEQSAGEPATCMIAHHATGVIRLARVGAAAARRAEAAFRRDEAEQLRERVEVAADPELFRRYVGWYASPLGLVVEVTRDGRRLLLQSSGKSAIEIHPESPSKFFTRLVAAQFSFETKGGVCHAMTLHQGGYDLRLTRVARDEARRAVAHIERRLAEQERPRRMVEIDPALLDGYAGLYRVDGSRTAKAEVDEGRLFIEISGQRRCEVFPEGERDFFWTVVAAQITFVPDEDGRITHAVLHQGGRDMPWPRIG